MQDRCVQSMEPVFSMATFAFERGNNSYQHVAGAVDQHAVALQMAKKGLRPPIRAVVARLRGKGIMLARG